MNDTDVIRHIDALVDEEHELRQRHSRDGLDDEERGRLEHLEVQLDQCWDLLRQRRARRAAGLDPDDASVRDAGTVEHYRQ
jgi:Protein of unknown function (DUF2630)